MKLLNSNILIISAAILVVLSMTVITVSAISIDDGQDDVIHFIESGENDKLLIQFQNASILSRSRRIKIQTI